MKAKKIFIYISLLLFAVLAYNSLRKKNNKVDLDIIYSNKLTDIAIIEIYEKLNEISDYGENLNVLNSSQQVVLIIENLETEINNGGFNQFYFRKDAAKAAPYLRQAALKPGAPTFLKGLAARFSLYGRQTLAGIIFLRGLIRQTNDEKTRLYLEKRLKALEIINSLENAVIEYRKLYGRVPKDLSELISKGLIEKIPRDPYGGQFVILENGRVYATSELIDRNERKRSAKGLGPGKPRESKQ